MSRSIKNSILLTVFVFYIVLYKLVIFDNFMKYSSLITASFLVILLGVGIAFLGFRRCKSTIMGNNVLKKVIFYIIVTFILMYALGFLVGFLKNAYSNSVLVMLDNIIAPIFIIICSELFRYVFISANKDKKLMIVLITTILIVFEIALNVRVIIFDFEHLFKLFSLIIIPVIVKNCVLSYICYHLGYRIPLIYRLIMDVYVFLVPVLPNLGDYLNSIFLITLPLIIYICAFSEIDKSTHKPEPVFTYEKITLLDLPIIIILSILICLVSGLFPYYLLGVGSTSMEPNISKGDAVIIKKIDGKSPVNKGQIIAYKKDNVIIIHRVVNLKKVNNKTVYITKGDANNANDSSTVSRKSIIGVVNAKVPIIAWPTVWLKEMITDK